MSRIYIVRHTDVDQAVHDDFKRPLTEKGEIEINRYVDYFKTINIHKIFSSNTIRTFSLAGSIAFDKDIPVYVSNRLNERIISKNWVKGLNFGEFVQHQWDDGDFHLYGGESLNDVRRRLQSLLNGIELDDSSNVLLVTHAATLTELIKIFGVTMSVDDYVNVGFGKVFMYDTNKNLFTKLEL
ncbi:histidine phosphatase family protein [Leuconostoc citreum]|uniref:histidine phosphatase family protein n=1 Tax=Leuconostoc citreum TaxID=33964 RepID=UPI0032DE9AE2